MASPSNGQGNLFDGAEGKRRRDDALERHEENYSEQLERIRDVCVMVYLAREEDDSLAHVDADDAFVVFTNEFPDSTAHHNMLGQVFKAGGFHTTNLSYNSTRVKSKARRILHWRWKSNGR